MEETEKDEYLGGEEREEGGQLRHRKLMNSARETLDTGKENRTGIVRWEISGVPATASHYNLPLIYSCPFSALSQSYCYMIDGCLMSFDIGSINSIA